MPTDVHQVLASAVGRPLPTDWRDYYTPDQADAYAAELGDLEGELDRGFAGWRSKTPFHVLPAEKVAWIKERLLRRSLILQGKGAHGVRIAWKGSGAARRPFAVAVRPHGSAPGTAYAPRVSVPHLVDDTGLPLATVLAALEAMPAETRGVRAWVRSWAAEASDAPA